MNGNGGTVRGAGFTKGIAFFGLGLMVLAAMVGQLVGFLPPARIEMVEYLTGTGLVFGVGLLVFTTRTLSRRL